MAEVRNVLFLCTGNTTRSIMAEAILNHDGGGRFCAFSAGSHPMGVVHPRSLERLAAEGIPIEGLRSKSWDEFAGADAPAMDLIVTVSNSAASETCPVWSGAPLSVHWRITDPTEFGPISQREAFAIGFQALRARIGAFLSLPIESLDSPDLKARLQAIGKMEQPAG
jgi:arsenate reductase